LLGEARCTAAALALAELVDALMPTGCGRRPRPVSHDLELRSLVTRTYAVRRAYQEGRYRRALRDLRPLLDHIAAREPGIGETPKVVALSAEAHQVASGLLLNAMIERWPPSSTGRDSGRRIPGVPAGTTREFPVESGIVGRDAEVGRRPPLPGGTPDLDKNGAGRGRGFLRQYDAEWRSGMGRVASEPAATDTELGVSSCVCAAARLRRLGRDLAESCSVLRMPLATRLRRPVATAATRGTVERVVR
jgi:hypothetical protein